MRIGEVAELEGVPTATLRYYERRGLLSRPARTESGYGSCCLGNLAALVKSALMGILDVDASKRALAPPLLARWLEVRCVLYT